MTAVTQIRELTAMLANLNVKRTELLDRRTKLDDLAAAESSARAALDAIAALDAESLSRWAAKGCAGPAPTADEKARFAAASRLSAASARAIAARAASATLDADLSAVSGEIAQANENLRVLRHARLVELIDACGAAYRLRMLEHAREEAFLLAAAQALVQADPAAARRIRGWRTDTEGSFLTRGAADPKPEALLADGRIAFARLLAAVTSDPESASIEEARRGETPLVATSDEAA